VRDATAGITITPLVTFADGVKRVRERLCVLGIILNVRVGANPVVFNEAVPETTRTFAVVTVVGAKFINESDLVVPIKLS
jgi:hypothetical protein